MLEVESITCNRRDVEVLQWGQQRVLLARFGLVGKKTDAWLIWKAGKYRSALSFHKLYATTHVTHPSFSMCVSCYSYYFKWLSAGFQVG